MTELTEGGREAGEDRITEIRKGKCFKRRNLFFCERHTRVTEDRFGDVAVLRGFQTF